MPDQPDTAPISAQDARRLFADWKTAPALVLAVSGGPDSVALMWLAARWRNALKIGPRLIAVTVDHGLRPEAASEARAVKRLAKALDIPHRTVRWTGVKPTSGVPAAAREARYRLLSAAARSHGASHILTAHTRDDQAETLLMRMARGSGIAGLAAMARESQRDGVILARPLLDIPKSRLIATLEKAGIGYATDATNSDTGFTRPRLRALMPALAGEGCDARNLSRLASRMARAHAALEAVVDAAEKALARFDGDAARLEFDAAAFAGVPEEIRVRLLARSIDRLGHEGPAELGKIETLMESLKSVTSGRSGGSGGDRVFRKRTLAGAMISLHRGCIVVQPAPKRLRHRR